MVGEQAVDSARFSIDRASGFLILTDESGETFPGFLNSFLVSDQALSEQAIADMGVSPPTASCPYRRKAAPLPSSTSTI